MSSYALKFKNPAELLKFIKDQDIQFIDLNFTDLRGKWQHTTEHYSAFDADKIEKGVYFDGSSIAGWKQINESDMAIVPDISKACMDPLPLKKQSRSFVMLSIQ